MRLRLLFGRAAMAALIAGLAMSAEAQTSEPPQMIAERIHSDVPLYTFSWPDLWPRNFYSDNSFGCTSQVAFGDWRFIPATNGDVGELWYRFSNYGVVHCAAILRNSDERSTLDQENPEYGFFVRLGKARWRSRDWELWAIQQGTVPGSDYTLLAREENERLVEQFTVLQQRCPSGKLRGLEDFDVWSTRYCAINSRAELLALARRMLRLPPVGTISRASEPAQPAPVG